MAIAGFSLLVLGIIFIIVAPINMRKNKRCTAQTQGTLKEIIETDSSDGNVGHTYVYSYYVNRKEYQMKSTAINNQVDKVGDQCTIWYNPTKPKEAQEFRYSSNKVYMIILIIGIIMTVLGLVLPIIGIGLEM